MRGNIWGRVVLGNEVRVSSTGKKNRIQKWTPWGALYVTQLCISQPATPAGQPFWNVSTIKPAKDSMCRTLWCQTPLVLILFAVKLLSKGKGIYNCLYTPGRATVNLSIHLFLSFSLSESQYISIAISPISISLSVPSSPLLNLSLCWRVLYQSSLGLKVEGYIPLEGRQWQTGFGARLAIMS